MMDGSPAWFSSINSSAFTAFRQHLAGASAQRALTTS
jgi:hypothetical protein